MILTATGEEYKPLPSHTSILTAEGEVYEPPEKLAQDEFRIVEKALGINKREGKPTRNEYRCGRLPDVVTVGENGEEIRHQHPTAALLNDMAARGLVRLYIDVKGLTKKAMKRVKEGDMTAGRLIAVVQKKGFDAFLETIRQAKAMFEAAKA